MTHIATCYSALLLGSLAYGISGCAGNESTGSGESKSGGAKACADLYDPGELVEFAVEIDAEQWSAMQNDCQAHVEEYRPITLHYGSESVAAMWRLKGNWSWNCDKLQFVISFNETDPDGRFHGLRKLVLDAPWYDHTLLHERLAMHYHQQRGVPHSCVNHARLEVNGEHYGVYANVERVDREYLERNFDDADGNLWKEGRELKTNDETGSSALIDRFWGTTSSQELGEIIDIPHALRVWSSLAMLPDPDSYWAGVEINFYLYEHPTRGLLFLPYDSDLAFGENIWPELATMDPITHEHDEWKREEQFKAVLSDPKWCERFVTELRAARDAYDVADLESKIDTWSEQIEGSIQTEPHPVFTPEEHETALAQLRTFPARRAAFIDEWLESNHCPVMWP